MFHGIRLELTWWLLKHISARKSVHWLRAWPSIPYQQLIRVIIHRTEQYIHKIGSVSQFAETSFTRESISAARTGTRIGRLPLFSRLSRVLAPHFMLVFVSVSTTNVARAHRPLVASSSPDRGQSTQLSFSFRLKVDQYVLVATGVTGINISMLHLFVDRRIFSTIFDAYSSTRLILLRSANSSSTRRGSHSSISVSIHSGDEREVRPRSRWFMWIHGVPFSGFVASMPACIFFEWFLICNVNRQGHPHKMTSFLLYKNAYPHDYTISDSITMLFEWMFLHNLGAWYSIW